MGSPRWSAVLLLLTFSTTEAARIIGGQEVAPYSIQYQASLQKQDGQHYCGGTLVHPQWVVSAAHCWRPSSLMKVVLGEHSLRQTDQFEQIFNVSKVYVHPYYRYWSYDNDIMLIQLSRPAELNANVEPARLPNGGTPELSNDVCTVSGWGVTYVYSRYLSPVLRAVNVTIQPNCIYKYWNQMTPNMLCAGSRMGGKDSCQGDSGGPLICNGHLEGIVSWGISCAHRYFPGVYTKVRNYVGWIQQVTD